MPTVVRKSNASLTETRREVLHAISWQVYSSVWSPPTDLFESEEALVVRVEIAGMKEEDFEVALENNVLLIAGTRSDSPERRAYHQMEIRFGKFATSDLHLMIGRWRSALGSLPPRWLCLLPWTPKLPALNTRTVS